MGCGSLRPLDGRSRTGRYSSPNPRRVSGIRPCRSRRFAPRANLLRRQVFHNLRRFRGKVIHNRRGRRGRLDGSLPAPLMNNFGNGISETTGLCTQKPGAPGRSARIRNPALQLPRVAPGVLDQAAFEHGHVFQRRAVPIMRSTRSPACLSGVPAPSDAIPAIPGFADSRPGCRLPRRARTSQSGRLLPREFC